MKTADKDYFLDADGKLAKGTKDAASLLVRKGQEIPADVQKQYFSETTEKKPEAASKTVSTKSKTPSQNK